jgi:2-polyprenyl-6-methoxyphenol hydroxylase-like FAD-dependent oxidoreductase
MPGADAGADAEVEVLIVGGGPVGLTARALLEPWCVRALLVEKHRELHEPADLSGLGPPGALLIRPDGHIGARWRDRPPSNSPLHHALTAITRSTPA